MEFYDKSLSYVQKYFDSDITSGLNADKVCKNRKTFGKNVMTEKDKQGFFSSLFGAIKEPMMIILCFAFVVSFGANLGKFFKTGEFDFLECFGILFAIILSISITLFMEGSSKKAFLALNKLYGDLTVRVIRNGEVTVVNQKQIVCGDVILLSGGDKIVSDGVLIEGVSLFVDESALTGETKAEEKRPCVLKENTPLAERVNSLYSGSFVTGGEGKMLVTAVGNGTEMGKIATELTSKKESDSPLQQKLYRLGKIITAIGLFCALVVFAFSLVKLITLNKLSFDTFQELLISCIVLIVAAVPEGLPTIVAVSLALNMIKLAKENALIKKMIATETAGAISVICSDKTGTLTENKMQVTEEVAYGKGQKYLLDNCVFNSKVSKGKNGAYYGSATEIAIYKHAENKVKRVNAEIKITEPFSSDKKYMITEVKENSEKTEYVKGAYEKLFPVCSLTESEKKKILSGIEKRENEGKRVLCFAHRKEEEKYIFDGYLVISDPVRKQVKESVSDCKRAGIKVKMLTGDNLLTAISIAKETGIYDGEKSAVTGTEIERLSDGELKERLKEITVIARSTPSVKLRVVKALKETGEVVAVTGDGINDAPAIKHADVGFAMGKTGSEITKESADVILTDDSFFTVVKAVSFGRNVYRNIQRFISFQLSVNLSALIVITLCAITGVETPFNTLQLLWINLIMDGPPALTLGLEQASSSLMSVKPVERKKSIVSKKMLIRILFNGFYIGVVVIAEYLTDFLRFGINEKKSGVFTLFVLFQLFNAFNCRELGSESIIKGISENKIMAVTFLAVFIVHVFIVEVCYSLFGLAPMSLTNLIKCVTVAFSIVAVWEIFKFFIRRAKGRKTEAVERANNFSYS